MVCLQPLGSVGVDQTEQSTVRSRRGPSRLRKTLKKLPSQIDLASTNFQLGQNESSLVPRLYSNCTIASLLNELAVDVESKRDKEPGTLITARSDSNQILSSLTKLGFNADNLFLIETLKPNQTF